MNNANRTVTKIPLTELWKVDQELMAERKRFLNKNEIKDIIKISKVEFVIADIGLKLNWLDVDDCYHMWKSNIEKHVANNFEGIEIESFPDSYAYIASEWKGSSGNPIILLEKLH